MNISHGMSKPINFLNKATAFSKWHLQILGGYLGNKCLRVPIACYLLNV